MQSGLQIRSSGFTPLIMTSDNSVSILSAKSIKINKNQIFAIIRIPKLFVTTQRQYDSDSCSRVSCFDSNNINSDFIYNTETNFNATKRVFETLHNNQLRKRK